MENKEKNNEPVHPTPHYNEVTGAMNGFSNGMSKRFYAACCAMQGILSNPVVCNNSITKEKMIKDSYEFADELLKQENE